MTLYERIVEDAELGTVRQYLRLDPNTGEMVGWEEYENGHKSEEQPVGRTLPLGYHKVEN